MLIVVNDEADARIPTVKWLDKIGLTYNNNTQTYIEA